MAELGEEAREAMLFEILRRWLRIIMLNSTTMNERDSSQIQLR